MSNLTNTNKINYLFKKSFGKPTTILEPELLQEPNIIFSDSLMVTFYDDSSNIESILKSEKAFIDNKKNIMLATGNVILTNNINMLNSEELIWDRQKNIIYTEEKVKIQTKKELILGEGFKSNPNFTEYEITKISGIFNLNNK